MVIKAFSPLYASIAIGNTYARATVFEDSVSAEGYSLGNNDDIAKYFEASGTPIINYPSFILSPQTSLTFTGNISLAAASSRDPHVPEGTFDYPATSEVAFAERIIVGYIYENANHDNYIYNNPNYVSGGERMFGGYSGVFSNNGFQDIYTVDFESKIMTTLGMGFRRMDFHLHSVTL